MSVKLEIESPLLSVVLTEYLNVQAGAGMDPANPQFTNKVFAHSLLRQGGTLALEDLKLRELVFPLTIQKTSKSAITLLVQEINQVINTAGATAEWQDENATVPTFFQIVSGQFDEEYDFRQGQQSHPMLKGKLRLFVQPLGQPELVSRPLLQAAAAATLTGSAPVMTFQAGSQIRGDAAALIEATVTTPGSTSFYSAVSVLPTASYNPFFVATGAAPSMSFEGTWTASANSALSGIVTGKSSGNGIWWWLTGSGVYDGPQRALVIAKAVTGSAAVIGMKAGEFFAGVGASEPGSPTVSTSTEWQLYDCGVLSRGSVSGGAVWPVRLTTSASVSIGGLILLPETTTSFLLATKTSTEVNTKLLTWNGVQNTISAEDALGYAPIVYTGEARGAIPTVTPGPNKPVLAVMLVNDAWLGKSRSFFVNVLERTRYVF